jgi:hypothetical protein
LRARLTDVLEAHGELVAIVNVMLRVERQAPFAAEPGGASDVPLGSANYTTLLSHVAQLGSRMYERWVAAGDAERALTAAQDTLVATTTRFSAARAELTELEAVVARCEPLVRASGEVLRAHAARLAELEQLVAAVQSRAQQIERDAVPPLAAAFSVARRLPRRHFGTLQSALSSVLDRMKASAAATQRLSAVVALCRAAKSDAAVGVDCAAVAADVGLVARLYGSSLRAEFTVAMDAARALQTSDALVRAAQADDDGEVDEPQQAPQPPPQPQPPQQAPPPQQQQPQRNVRALAIVRRIKQKLETRDQVGAIIEQATNADNLACMFEGWIPFF